MIFFNIYEARKQLVSSGFVYTLRSKMRRIGKDIAVHGSYYRHESIGEVSIDFIKQIENASELEEYLSVSGFERLEDWLGVAAGSKFLFKVRLV